MYTDREQAGKMLAEALRDYHKAEDTIVFGIPRGGLPVAGVIAGELNLPMDVVLVKKIGHPEDSEYAIGAVSLEGRIINSDAGINENYLDKETGRLTALLKERDQQYHKTVPPLPVKGKTVLLVDDGVATGQTFMAAIDLLKKAGAKSVVAAIPVAPRQTIQTIRAKADEVFCLQQPAYFRAIGLHYVEFSQLTDEQAIRILENNRKKR